jgi:hypothetical protein
LYIAGIIKIKDMIKNFITVIFTFITINVYSQWSVTNINSFSGVTKISVSYCENKYGFFAEIGGNWFERGLGMNEVREFDVTQDFTSSVSWFDENGSFLPTMPNTNIWTSEEWGNTLLDEGEVSNIVTTSTKTYSEVKNITNVGMVIKKNENISYRFGVGLFTLKQNGNGNVETWTNKFNVYKYHDDLEVVNSHSHNFIVAVDKIAETKKETNKINFKEVKLNLNFSVDFNFNETTQFNLGLDTRSGLNFGIGYRF